MRILLGQNPIKVLNAAVATGPGIAIDVSNYEHIIFQLYTTGSATATIKFGISMSLTKPDFSIAPSATNVYDYVDLTPLNNQVTPVVGGTGIVVAGTDIIKLYQVDTNFVKWICPIIISRSAGAVSCDLNAANNWTR